MTMEYLPLEDKDEFNYIGYTKSMRWWSYSRRPLTYLFIQHLFLVCLVAIFIFVFPISEFLWKSFANAAVVAFVAFYAPLTILWIGNMCKGVSQLQILSVMVFFLSCNLSIAVICTLATVPGKFLMEFGILSTVAFMSMLIYSFWAEMRCHEVTYIGPSLFSSVLVVIAFVLIQHHTPLGSPQIMIFSLFAALAWSNFLLLDIHAVDLDQHAINLKSEDSVVDQKEEAGGLEVGDACV